MSVELKCAPRVAGAGLRGVASADLHGEPLQTFAFRRPSPDRAGPGLPFLGGALESEHWLAEGPVSQGRRGDVTWRRGEGVVFLAFEGEDGHDLGAWPGARVAGLRGDICRRELLVEIEAVARI